LPRTLGVLRGGRCWFPTDFPSPHIRRGGQPNKRPSRVPVFLGSSLPRAARNDLEPVLSFLFSCSRYKRGKRGVPPARTLYSFFFPPFSGLGAVGLGERPPPSLFCLYEEEVGGPLFRGGDVTARSGALVFLRPPQDHGQKWGCATILPFSGGRPDCGPFSFSSMKVRGLQIVSFFPRDRRARAFLAYPHRWKKGGFSLGFFFFVFWRSVRRRGENAVGGLPPFLPFFPARRDISGRSPLLFFFLLYVFRVEVAGKRARIYTCPLREDRSAQP